MAKPSIQDLTRQLLIQGTSCITDATGNTGYKTEVVVAGALLRIADALEKQNELARVAGPGFQPEQYLDGISHLAMQQSSDSRLVYIQILSTSPAMALAMSRNFGDILQEMVRVANEGSYPLEGEPASE